MTRSIVIGLGLLLFTGTVQGANVNTNAGTSAFLFSFDDFDLSSFNGGIGFRHYLKDRLAFRPGLSFEISTNRSEERREREIRDEIIEDTSDSDRLSAGIGVSVALERHLGSHGSRSPYIGIEGEYRWSGTVQEDDDYPYAPGWTLKEVYSTNSASLSGLLGFEWGFAESFSLGGEYQLSFSYSSTSRETETSDPYRRTETEQSDIDLDLFAASIYLSIEL